jgi:hypothetical protein
MEIDKIREILKDALRKRGFSESEILKMLAQFQIGKNRKDTSLCFGPNKGIPLKELPTEYLLSLRDKPWFGAHCIEPAREVYFILRERGEL